MGQKFVYVGVATNPTGKTKLWFSNNPVVQIKKLTKLGYTDIDGLSLLEPTEKLKAAFIVLEELRGRGGSCPDRLANTNPSHISACLHVIDHLTKGGKLSN